MKKPVYLSLSILQISRLVMCEFCYDYVKAKSGEKEKLCYIDRNIFLIYIKVEEIY